MLCYAAGRAGAKLILCNDFVAQRLEKSMSPKFMPSSQSRWIVKNIKDFEIFCVTSLKKDSGRWTRPDIAVGSTVYLQYSSDSTITPI